MPTRLPVAPAPLALAALAAVALATASAAQDEAAEQRPSLVPLTEQVLSETTTLSATEVTFPPGFSSPSHRHAGSLFVYVLEGEVRSGIDDGEIVLYGPGDSWFEAQGVEHSVFENVSATEPLRVLIVSVGPPREPAPAAE